jgi:hypothetical protein
VGWDYLFQVLESFGFNKEVIQCIKTLYSCPTARIKTNGHLSLTIKLERGARQGCNLSPTLFSLSLEPLAQAIRQDPTSEGITIRGREHKICMYPDDVLLFLEDSGSSGPRLIGCFTNIWNIFGVCA